MASAYCTLMFGVGLNPPLCIIDHLNCCCVYGYVSEPIMADAVVARLYIMIHCHVGMCNPWYKSVTHLGSIATLLQAYGPR